MIRKLKDGKYRFYSRKKDEKFTQEGREDRETTELGDV